MPLAHAHTLPLRAPGEQFFGVGVVDKPHGVGHVCGNNCDSCHDVTRRHDASLWGKFITFRRGVRVTGPGSVGLAAAVRGFLRGVISENMYNNRTGEHLGVLKIRIRALCVQVCVIIHVCGRHHVRLRVCAIMFMIRV